ncbi:MAG: acyl-CoA dehydratase activase-related protein [Propionibacteriaceae bacterium]|jgi:predicted CoA-substrate-specific enzyme activase|nr:acyl-CoA dehydratase activase-related protein [Propionibacteriaceae bacterium]
MAEVQLRLGIDVGSTTVKAVLTDGNHMLFSDYRRHNAEVQGELAQLLKEVAGSFPGRRAMVAITGSAGLGLASKLDVPFVQEVIAETTAIQRLDPAADMIIELGGEDAKITYLGAIPEQRMNGTCAGGTGAFIDQMATLLDTDAPGLNKLASKYKTLYPIASRCGVFAKSDLQPLLNDGARKEDLAASIFQAVATQTIAGLACGRPIKGRVVFLGGPLHFLPELRAAFARALENADVILAAPEHAQLMVAWGAAMLAEHALDLDELQERAANAQKTAKNDWTLPSMRPLFLTADERETFQARHKLVKAQRADIAQASGPVYLGIDAGSTTIKSVLLDDQMRILHSTYASNGGDPVKAATRILTEVRELLPGKAAIVGSCVTGYGEGLIRAALHVDTGEVETIAHYRAADHLCPGVTSVIDIGGQDMKYLAIADEAVDSICVNEACSSGCGSFLETFAKSLGISLGEFVTQATSSDQPVDLGSRCTVFMNSSVKQAQKEGASLGDIAAGLSYSVVRNALYKVIKLRDPKQLGARVVVQGGTFRNDAVLRAFELLTGLEVVRPDIAELMGAFGAALLARERRIVGAPSSLLPPLALKNLTVKTHQSTCTLCQNHCRRTISEFPDGGRYVTGNRCERGESESGQKSELPNLFDYKYRRVFAYRRLTERAATRGDIGIPRALNMYENYPLWFTILTKLGFRVMLSGRSSHALFEKGMNTIASENICYPAKLTHGHIEQLVEQGVKTIWYPSVTFERELVEGADNHYNCPVVAQYPQVIAANMPTIAENNVKLLKPFVNLANPDKLAERLVDILSEYGVTLEEAQAAVEAGYEEQERYHSDVRKAGREALEYLERTGKRGVVLAGRPYHIDPETHHGIPELINSLGMAVLSEDAICDSADVERPLRVHDQWAYHSRLYAAADAIGRYPNLELVQLNSFGCGLDAITSDQVAEILRAKGKVYTTLKIDEVSNLGAARIRLRSLAAAAEQRRVGQVSESYGIQRRLFTKQMRKEHTLIAPQMAPVQFSLLVAAFRSTGLNVELLEHAGAADVEAGLKTVHNDACYPAIMVVGQLVRAFQDGLYDPHNSSVLITQTGGVCRATNYVSLLRKALQEAGYPQVPVIAISTQGFEKNPGFSITPTLFHRVMQAVCLGDLLQSVTLRQRPYEAVPGSTLELYRHWDDKVKRWLHRQWRCSYKSLIEKVIADFDALPVRDIPRKPRVGVVGEILVKFHPDANNNVIDVIESEGCEAVVPGLMEFFLKNLYTPDWNWENLGTEKHSRFVKRGVRWYMELYRTPVKKALRKAKVDYNPPGDIPHMIELAQEVVSLGNRAGEGWLLTAEILELIENGVQSVICAQPFACLPNHVTGKGMFRKLQSLHPEVGLVAIDYDPGASEVNQLNRIKLLLSSRTHAAVDERVPASV